MVPATTVPVFLVLLSIALSAEGFKTVNEVCVKNSISPSDPKNCDASQYLNCARTGLCACNYNLFWQASLQKCTFAVRGVCTDAFGSPGWPGSGDGQQGGNGPSPGCPVNAFCDARGTGRCECNDGYTPNEDLTECSAGRMLQSAISTSIGLILCYFVAIKLFS